VKLTVKDNAGAAASDTVSIVVTKRPVANAGSDQFVNAGASVSLTGTGSYDPDGTITSYAWVQTAGTSVSLSGADTTQPTFTAPAVSETLTFQLTVTDNYGKTGTDTVNIIINLPPVANAGADQVVLRGSSYVTLTGSASYDPEGLVISHQWVQTAGTTVTLNGANTARSSFLVPSVSGTLTFELTVKDNRGATASDSVNIIVNTAPTANAGPDQLVKIRAAVTLDGRGSTDSDGTIAGYAWTQVYGTPVTLTGANTATPSFVAPDTEAYPRFRLTVTDNHGATAYDEVYITVTKSGR
jgi:hypothetical protein